MELTEALGIAIESERIAAHISREDLAAAVGVSIDTLGRHIRGEQEPSISRLRSIADAMGVTAQEILDRADQTIGRVTKRAEVAQQNSGGTNVQIAGNVEGSVTVEAEGRS
ncbi:MAG: helix-turn-helix transcriptional regulator [Propionicimonas sp.]